MSTRDLLLIDLYRAPRESHVLALAARHAPILRFDANEPFLPLAAGYTLFEADGPSPSMKRAIQLRPAGKPPAARALEFAIWWDWDIHHLYELEHVWVYLDQQDRPVRLEASWHGKYNEIPLQLEDGRAVLLSEPGKHAFSGNPAWFRKRAAEYRRPETRAVGLHATVLVNSFFKGKIRERVFDRVLARSFLAQQVFTPSWDFSQKFSFHTDWLVPWPVLEQWIPQRVNAVLERLQASTPPSDYRALRLADSSSTMQGLRRVAQAGADMAYLRVTSSGEQVVLAGDGTSLDDVYDFCKSEPMGTFLEPDSIETTGRLAAYIKRKEMHEYAVITSGNNEILSGYREAVPGGLVSIKVDIPEQESIAQAKEFGAVFVGLVQPGTLTPQWIERVHREGLGIVGWPVRDESEADQMESLGLDVVWMPLPHG